MRRSIVRLLARCRLGEYLADFGLEIQKEITGPILLQAFGDNSLESLRECGFTHLQCDGAAAKSTLCSGQPHQNQDQSQELGSGHHSAKPPR